MQCTLTRVSNPEQRELFDEAMAAAIAAVEAELDVKPPVFFVRRDEYAQLACRHCQTIVAEPVAPALIDRG